MGHIGGDLRLARIGQGRLEIGDVEGDVELHIIGASCTLHDVGGDVQVDNAGDLALLGWIQGDLRLRNIHGALDYRRERVGGDLHVSTPTMPAQVTLRLLPCPRR